MAKPADKSTALWVLRRLRNAGHQALFAGGCVRDMLLGLRSYDYDVATDATPRQVRGLFRHVLLVGAKFGVAMVVHRGRRVEVTTFRSDASYSDGRRPDAVTFSTPREDAQRRDFTINGMFYDPQADEVIDYVGGRADLEARILRTIGPAEDRFAEDYLRMLRAVRFAVRFDLAVAPATAEAVRAHAANITSISGERVFDELTKMLSAPSAAEALRLMEALGLGRFVLGELFETPGVWRRAVDRVEALAGRKDATLALAGLLLEMPGRTISRRIRAWGAGNELRDGVRWIAENASGWRRAADEPLREFKRMLAHPESDRLRAIWRVEEQRQTGRISLSRRIAARAESIAGEDVAPQPLVSGADLIALGVRPGPALGRMLRALYDEQLDEALRTRREALARARELAEVE